METFNKIKHTQRLLLPCYGIVVHRNSRSMISFPFLFFIIWFVWGWKLAIVVDWLASWFSFLFLSLSFFFFFFLCVWKISPSGSRQLRNHLLPTNTCEGIFLAEGPQFGSFHFYNTLYWTYTEWRGPPSTSKWSCNVAARIYIENFGRWNPSKSTYKGKS